MSNVNSHGTASFYGQRLSVIDCFADVGDKYPWFSWQAARLPALKLSLKETEGGTITRALENRNFYDFTFSWDGKFYKVAEAKIVVGPTKVGLPNERHFDLEFDVSHGNLRLG